VHVVERYAFSALTLLVRQQEGHLSSEKYCTAVFLAHQDNMVAACWLLVGYIIAGESLL